MKLIPVLVVALLLSLASRAHAEAPPPWVVKAFFTTPGQLNLLSARTQPWEVDQAKGFAIVELANGFERQQLLNLGLRLELDEERTALLHKPTQPSAKSAKSIPGFSCYRTVEETHATINQLVRSYPLLAASVDIGDSWEKQRNAANGYDLRVLKLTNQAVAGPKPILFAMSSVHAREYTPAELMTRFAENLLLSYGQDADVTWMLDHHEVQLLLQANPDGRKRAETGLNWRKNTNEAYCSPTSNTRGADLNRNFPFAWGAYGGSSGVQCDLTYRGPTLTSEPETQAIVAYVRSIFADNRGANLLDAAPSDTPGLFFDIHSFSQLVLWPYGFDADPLTPLNQGSSNDAGLRTLGRRFAWFNGYAPQQAVELYPTDGTTLDFAYGELGVASYTFELGNAFFEPCANFAATILPDNERAMRYALKVARAPYQLPSGPDALNVLGSLISPAEAAFVAAQIDDSAFSARNGIEAVHSISGAAVYVDSLPWLAGSTPVAQASALDGDFSQSREAVTATFASPLTPGRHVAWVQGRDSSGALGPLGSAFITVADPKTTARISGTLRDARNGAPIRNRGTLSADRLGALSSTRGIYAIRLPPGSRTLTASVNGYLNASVGPLNLNAGLELNQNIAMTPQCAAFRDLLDADISTWSAQLPWATSTTRSFSAPRSFTDSPSGNYANNASTSLVSPLLNASGFAQTELRFASWCDTEANRDFGRVDLSVDGGASYSQIWSCSGRPTWEEVRIALPTAAQQAQVRVRFRFTADSSVNRDGWYVDNVELIGGSLSCPFTQDIIFDDGFQ